jgi:uncharacterized Fe-S cluster protein YjdI
MVKLTPDSAFVESVQSATRQPSHNEACVRGNPSVQTTSICAVDAPHPEKANPERKMRMPEKARFNEPAG